MSAPVTFTGRLAAVLIPTKAQALGSLVVSLVLLVLAQGESLLNLLGVSEQSIDLTKNQFDQRFSVILHTPLASNAALVTFWASVGLVAYLICWSFYNLIVEARNEVTLNTQYTNRGHWQGPIQTLALKAVAASLLVALISFTSMGVALWLTLVAPLVVNPTAVSAGMALLGVLGFALQLYLVLALVLVTITPWYREETFTDQ